MIVVYTTFPNEKEARRAGKALVKEKLAACVNVIPKTRAIYFWKRKLCENSEAIAIMKTSERHYEKLEHRLRELHAYEVPCIIAIEPKRGAREFVNWVEGL